MMIPVLEHQLQFLYFMQLCRPCCLSEMIYFYSFSDPAGGDELIHNTDKPNTRPLHSLFSYSMFHFLLYRTRVNFYEKVEWRHHRFGFSLRKIFSGQCESIRFM